MAKQESSAAVLDQPLSETERHQRDKAQRQERRSTLAYLQHKKDCCDPEKAAFHYSQIAKHRFAVSYTHGKHGKFESEEIAKDAAEAWAKFCDRFPKLNHPGPKDPARVVKCLGPVAPAS